MAKTLTKKRILELQRMGIIIFHGEKYYDQIWDLDKKGCKAIGGHISAKDGLCHVLVPARKGKHKLTLRRIRR